MKQKHIIETTVWAVHYSNHFTSFSVQNKTMAMENIEGWVKVQDVNIEVDWDCEICPTNELVVQLKAKARLMQATFEAAHSEVLDEINKLLAIGMDLPVSDTDDCPF